LLQTVAVILVLTIAGAGGYYARHAQLTSIDDISVSAAVSGSDSQTAAAGDYTSFLQTEQNALNFVNAGNMSEAVLIADDLEYTWDNSEATLKTNDSTKWNQVDRTIDSVLRQLRAVKPDATACASALEASIAAMQG
jgi:hypothetical protein